MLYVRCCCHAARRSASFECCRHLGGAKAKAQGEGGGLNGPFSHTRALAAGRGLWRRRCAPFARRRCMAVPASPRSTFRHRSRDGLYVHHALCDSPCRRVLVPRNGRRGLLSSSRTCSADVSAVMVSVRLLHACPCDASSGLRVVSHTAALSSGRSSFRRRLVRRGHSAPRGCGRPRSERRRRHGVWASPDCVLSTASHSPRPSYASAHPSLPHINESCGSPDHRNAFSNAQYAYIPPPMYVFAAPSVAERGWIRIRRLPQCTLFTHVSSPSRHGRDDVQDV
ncbi:hypothetical protein BD414DRAFT_307748 [Trametes punicea]|nr:hypothetical protein BD414DRAFT_307748 [Trametes punicea]